MIINLFKTYQINLPQSMSIVISLTVAQPLTKVRIIPLFETLSKIMSNFGYFERICCVKRYGKKFKKEHVYEIYKQYISPKLNLRPATRDEKRVVTLFFNNLAEINQTENIIKCLEDKKEEIINTILKDIDKKKLNKK